MLEEKIISWSALADKLIANKTSIDLIKYVAINNVLYLKDKCNEFDYNKVPLSLKNELEKEDGINELWLSNYDLENDDLFNWLNIWIGIYDILNSFDKEQIEKLKPILLDVSLDNISAFSQELMLNEGQNDLKIFDLIPGNVLERIGEIGGTRKK